MGKERERSRIDIILDAPCISLRGTSGTTVEPAVLSGHVSLYLAKDTDIREVNLHFRGKAKVPRPTTESLITNSSMQNYTFCSHDWSFLESICSSSPTISSEKRSLPQVRTLKAGRHIFPFTFSLTGNLPSTLTSHPLSLNISAFPTTSRASITYKLRAVASRPGLSIGPLHNVHITPLMLHNLTCTTPVHVLRSLNPEALEYQLSLEMENTWPEKLMYSIMLPHKAWAAGDTLVAVLKLCPLAKGVRVENVVTTLWETTQLHIQQHHHPEDATHLPHHGNKTKVVHNVTRIVRCVKHKIVNGKAVRVDLVIPAGAKSSGGSNTHAGNTSRPGSAMDHPPSDANSNIDTFGPGPALTEEENGFTGEEFENRDVVTYITFPIPHLATGPHSSTQTTPTSASSPSVIPSFTAPAPTSTPQSPPPSSLGFSSYSYSPTPLPYTSGSSATPPSFSQSSSATINPTHKLPPIVVSHRIRWSFSIHNRDGHTSELRCSLPVHILDGRILSEARDASVLTRRMALVAEGLWSGEEGEEDLGLGGMGTGASGLNEGVDIFVDRELPSYMSHVRDRVANMYYPEVATVRVPWVDIAASGGTAAENVNWDDGDVEGGFSQLRSQSPLTPQSPHFQWSPRSPSGGQGTLAHLHLQVPRAPSTSSSSSPLDWVNTDLPTPPERNQSALQASRQIHSEVHSQSGSPEENTSGSSALFTTSDGHAQGTGTGHPVRSLSSLLKATMKPFTALSQHHGNGKHGLLCFSKTSLPDDDVYGVPLSLGPPSSRPLRTRRASIPPTFPSTSSFPPSSTSRSHLLRPSLSASPIVHHSISEVPDYFVASQGFLGGVPPLSSLMGLPSYEEAAREDHSEQQTADHDVEEHSSTSGNHGIGSTDPSESFVSGPSLNVDNGIDLRRSTFVERPPD